VEKKKSLNRSFCFITVETVKMIYELVFTDLICIK